MFTMGAWGLARRRWLGVALGVLALSLAMVGCRAQTTALPQTAGGTYSSDAYHFRMTYPNGWKLVEQQSTGSAVPLVVTLTRISALQASNSFVSTLTVTVFDLHAPDEATPYAQLQAQIHDKKTPLKQITLAGHPAYRDAPTQQTSPDGKTTVTHTDYYLLTSVFEYQISTDAVSSENADADLSAMVTSFTLQ